jgi:hypothetical protein
MFPIEYLDAGKKLKIVEESGKFLGGWTSRLLSAKIQLKDKEPYKRNS